MHPSGVAKSSTSFGWGKGGNVTSAGWQVTLCDPTWHVSSRSGVEYCELLYQCYWDAAVKSIQESTTSAIGLPHRGRVLLHTPHEPVNVHRGSRSS